MEIGAADVIRTESLQVREQLLERGIAEKRVVHAYPGVDLDHFTPPAGPPEGPRIAFIGTLSLWKGVDIVAEVARRLRGRVPVSVVGGPVCSWSRRIAAEASLSYWRDVRELLQASSVLILPSASDGFGYVVLEALACGCVPIVSPEVGAAEIVRTLHPDLVQPRATFADAVPELLHSVPLMELRSAARSLAESFPRRVMARVAAMRVLSALEE
jgi:glycosyltransferase involved in cell wall biosynthesis